MVLPPPVLVKKADPSAPAPPLISRRTAGPCVGWGRRLRSQQTPGDPIGEKTHGAGATGNAPAVSPPDRRRRGRQRLDRRRAPRALHGARRRGGLCCPPPATRPARLGRLPAGGGA